MDNFVIFKHNPKTHKSSMSRPMRYGVAVARFVRESEAAEDGMIVRLMRLVGQNGEFLETA